MKIAIIGNAGSGKSTLGLKLHNILHIPLYHLDQYFWKPNWQEPNYDEYEKIHNKLCDQDEWPVSRSFPLRSNTSSYEGRLSEGWVIEGMNTRILEYRIKKADVVIFLDMPRYLCFLRVFKRMISCFGKVEFSSAKECRQGIPSLKFLKFIWHFNTKQKVRIMNLIEKYKDQKKIFIVKNDTELNALIDSFAKQ